MKPFLWWSSPSDRMMPKTAFMRETKLIFLGNWCRVSFFLIKTQDFLMNQGTDATARPGIGTIAVTASPSLKPSSSTIMLIAGSTPNSLSRKS